jgi:aquaporin Z
MVLVMAGPGSAILAAKSIGVLGVATAFGIVLLLLVYAIGGISGCHVNPAVTLGAALARKIRVAEIPLYWAAQVVGACLGALVIYGIATGQKGFDATKSGFASNGYAEHSPSSPGFNLGSAIIVEIAFTALLVLVVLATTHSKFPVGFAGLAVGGALWVIHLATIPVDNTSVNPARSLGVAIFQGTWALEQLWVFIIFPLIGAGVGWLIWRFIHAES